MRDIREKMRDWYLGNKRSLPWREIKDPYRIWVSEIILQQTRIQQGTDYYHHFLEKFPDLESLAAANEDDVLKVWQGLGYYSRARNLHASAKYVIREKDGVFPASYNALLELTGIGPYTAAAVASMAFREPRAVVDGNVHRVLSRLFGIAEIPGLQGASSRIVQVAGDLLDRDDPGTHNQALMELGALVCTSRQPACPSCPLSMHCTALREDRIPELPVRAKSPLRRKRYFHYLVIQEGNCLWMGRRETKDIWKGLYEFPLIETSRNISPVALVRTRAWMDFFGKQNVRPTKVSELFRHILSHQEILARFYRIQSNDPLHPEGYEKVCDRELHRYPVPKLISRYLDRLSD